MTKGTVIKSTGSWYYVKNEAGDVVPSRIRGHYRIRGIRATNPVAVGDTVHYDYTDDHTGMIRKIDERKNYIIRRATNLSREYQLIAANIDQALLMISLIHPATHLAFVDRFLVSAEAFRIPVILVFNKLDLYREKEKQKLEELSGVYGDIGYRVMSLSLKMHQQTEGLREVFRDKVTVVAGNSGVGKSTLLNYLDPSLQIKTSSISELHKSGQHTTTYAEMYFMENGARIIDTPGIKGYGMVDIDKEELFHFFPEIFRASHQCRFHNCMHVNEPDCAVIRAVERGEISSSRYMNYLDLLDDMGDKYRK